MQVLYFHDEGGSLISLPASWTSFAAKDAVALEIPGELRFDIAAHIANMIQSCMEVTT